MKNTLKLIVLALGLTLSGSGALAQSDRSDADVPTHAGAGPDLPERGPRDHGRPGEVREHRGPRHDEASSETREVRPESRRDRSSSEEPSGLRRERRRDRDGNGRGEERGFARGGGEPRGPGRHEALEDRGLGERSGPPRERAELPDHPRRHRRGGDDRFSAGSDDRGPRRAHRDEVGDRPQRRMERAEVGPRHGGPMGPRFEGRGREQGFRREGSPGVRGPGRDEGRGPRGLRAEGRPERVERGVRGDGAGHGGRRSAEMGDRHPRGGRDLAPRDEDRGPRGEDREFRSEDRRGGGRGSRG